MRGHVLRAVAVAIKFRDKPGQWVWQTGRYHHCQIGEQIMKELLLAAVTRDSAHCQCQR
jgi:hypothetical protein